MGRWTFEGGSPLYVPDRGEDEGEGPGFLGHALGQAAGMLGEGYEGLMGSAPVRAAGQVLGIPGRGVTTAGHMMGGYDPSTAPPGAGRTDPLSYVLTGEKLDPEDLAHYGKLLADTMTAEGTIEEGSAGAWAIRKAGEAISDPVILAGVARAAARPSGQPPPPRSVAPKAAKSAPEAPPAAAPGPKRAKGTRYRQPPADRPSAASEWPSVPMDPDFAAPGAFTRGGVGALPKPPRGTRGAAARPLDPDLAYGAGPTRGLPRTKADVSRGRKLKRAVGEMEAEFGPQPLPAPPAQMRSLIQAAVEQGASADDIMQLLTNLGG